MKLPHISLLDRYLFKQSTYLLLVTLSIGTGVYLLTDLFERMDNFIEAQIAIKYILLFIAGKIPFIVAQILPAAFLLSVIIQLCLMARSRELLALYVGGISLWRIVAFFVCFGLFWGIVQIFLSQNLGVAGNRYAISIWHEHVFGKVKQASMVNNFWFLEDNKMFYVKQLNIDEEKGTDLVCYDLSDDGLNVDQVIRVPSFDIQDKTWLFHSATIYDTNGFVHERNQEIPMYINYSLRGLRVLGDDIKLADYSLWQIGDAIKRLEKSGSNVENLKAAWHMKVAYGASLVVMSLIAVALITWQDNMYINIGLGLIITFLFYTALTVGGTLGEKGRVAPVIAVWTPIVLSILLALLRVIRVAPPKFILDLNKSGKSGN